MLDLLEESSPDCLTMLNDKICFQLDARNFGERDGRGKAEVNGRGTVEGDLMSDREMLQRMLLFSKDMQKDMEDVISQLQTQIISLVSGYKVLKSKNTLLEYKLKTMNSENVCKHCRKKKYLKDKWAKKHDHSSRMEEFASDKLTTEVSLPSPPRLDPQLLVKISNILSQSENFLKPVEQSLTTLQLKMQKYQVDNDFESNRLSMSSDYENESDNSFSSANYYSI